ncbi:hypothetical protein D9M69_692590 [compost metagenome]
MRTTLCGSTTSTPSLRPSITSSLTCACVRAAAWLLKARASSRARRSASWLASTATRKKPVPVRPDCRKRGVDTSLRTAALSAASPSMYSVMLAAVASASVKEPRMAASSTGSANSGV